jgi:hypothetical protein
MPMIRLLANCQFGAANNQVFEPADIEILATAYEGAVQALHLTDHADARMEGVAKRIIELARLGERDPVRLREYAVEGLTTDTRERSAA